MNNEEILKEAKRLYKTATTDQKYVLESLFPGLKESEDERIREVLIDYFNRYKEQEECGIKTFFGIPTDNILAWLEKQKSVGEIVERCKKSWYNEGKIQGQIEGLTDDEKYQQGWHDALEKQGEQEPIEWKDSDEKYLFWALLSIQKDIAASEINGVNTKDLNDCVKWLYSLKQRIKGE